MPYTVKKPPGWLKSLPEGAIKIGVEVFNTALKDSDDEDKARQAAWGAIKNKYEKGDDGIWRAKEDVSLEEIQNMLWNAVQEAQGQDTYVSQVYPSYLIYEKDGKYFKVGWSIMDGEVRLGSETVEVEKTWVEARGREDEAEETLETYLRLDEAKDPEGAAWDVTICEPGFTKNGWYLPEDALRDAEGLFEGVDVNLYELPDKGATHVPDALFDLKNLLVKNKVGVIDKVRYVAGEGLKGVLHFVESAAWLGRNMLDAMKSGTHLYGLSYDCPVRAKKDTVEGRSVFRLIKFLSADSVDIVSRPAAGGKFNRAVASRQAQRREIMDKEQLWNLINEKRPDLLDGKDLESISDEELTGLARMAMESPEKKDPPGDGGGGDPPATDNFVTKEELDLWRCDMALDKALGASGLPEKAQKIIRTRFEKTVFEEADLERAIADQKDLLAAQEPKGDDPVPGSGVTGGLGTLERAQMAVDRLFGLSKDDMLAFQQMERLDHQPFFEDMRSRQDYEGFDEVPTFTGLRELYTFFTGDPEVTGHFNKKVLPADLRAKMDITSTTFSYVLGNTLSRRLVKDYLATNFLEDLLISIKKPVKDFRQQEAVLVGYFGDLADVDPEAADYDEIAAVTDEESTYTLAQKGNILTITRKTIINDDLSLIQRLVGRLGRAARRTHAKYVWNFFINNSNCSDGTAWFTSGHGNLGSAALSFANGLIAYKALAKMTEKDSGERIGLLDDPNVKPVIVGPIDIMETIEQVVNDDHYYSSNDLTTKTRNPLKGKVTGHAITLFTDANDWGMLLPANVIDMVEMGYLNGRQEPEMFVADSPQSEQVFVADKIRHKIRHEYAGTPIDYRSGYKAVVA